jgi:hypothetical protein
MQKPIVTQNDTKYYTHLVSKWTLKMISLVLYFKLTNKFWFLRLKLAQGLNLQIIRIPRRTFKQLPSGL